MTTIPDQFSQDKQWRRMVSARLGEPVAQPQTTLAALATDYPAADWAFCTVALTDGAASKFLVISNGTAWYYMDGSAV